MRIWSIQMKQVTINTNRISILRIACQFPKRTFRMIMLVVIQNWSSVKHKRSKIYILNNGPPNSIILSIPKWIWANLKLFQNYLNSWVKYATFCHIFYRWQIWRMILLIKEPIRSNNVGIIILALPRFLTIMTLEWQPGNKLRLWERWWTRSLNFLGFKMIIWTCWMNLKGMKWVFIFTNTLSNGLSSLSFIWRWLHRSKQRTWITKSNKLFLETVNFDSKYEFRLLW